MSKSRIFEKYDRLKKLLTSFRSVAVAFSGGVDSSLLLYAAIESLGNENVIAIHGRSCLNQHESNLEEFHRRNFPGHNYLQIVDLKPLNWPEFINHSNKICCRHIWGDNYSVTIYITILAWN